MSRRCVSCASLALLDGSPAVSLVIDSDVLAEAPRSPMKSTTHLAERRAQQCPPAEQQIDELEAPLPFGTDLSSATRSRQS